MQFEGLAKIYNMKSLYSQRFLLLLSIGLFSLISYTQTITTAIENITTCQGSIIIPVTVNNFNEVAAMSLNLDYNDQGLNYTGYQNPHDSLSSGMLIVNSAGGQVIISWISLVPANIGNDTLIELQFSTSTSGIYDLAWDTFTPGNCEYSDINWNILPVNFVNGTLTILQSPMINFHPENSSIYEGENTSFYVNAIGTSMAYQWQVSANGGTIWNDLSNSSTYSGVTGSTLNITGTTISMDGYLYRCYLSGICHPDTTTIPAILTVNPTPTS